MKILNYLTLKTSSGGTWPAQPLTPHPHHIPSANPLLTSSFLYQTQAGRQGDKQIKTHMELA